MVGLLPHPPSIEKEVEIGICIGRDRLVVEEVDGSEIGHLCFLLLAETFPQLGALPRPSMPGWTAAGVRGVISCPLMYLPVSFSMMIDVGAGRRMGAEEADSIWLNRSSI
jgi:hypothetical protein